MRKEDLTYVLAWTGSSGGKPRAKAWQEEMTFNTSVPRGHERGKRKARGKAVAKVSIWMRGEFNG